jgi:GT2 family glycosyltransferase
LPIFFSYLDRLEDHGFRCAGIIGENGSRDRTRALIKQAVGRRIDFLDTAFMAEGANRLARMAMGRQALLERAKARGTAEDYVCVADLDNVMIAPPDPAAVKTAIERLRADKALFAAGATSRPVYYDLLSLRAEGHDYSQLNAEIRDAKRKPLSYFRFHQLRIYRNQRLMTRPEPIPCLSSFNGFCLYKAEDYYLGTYRADNEADVCEHVSVNRSIAGKTGKGMFIAPELIVRTPADHAPVGFFRFWTDRMRKLLRSSQ